MFLAAIYKDCQLHAPRPAEVDQLVKRRAYSSTRVKDVIDQDDAAAFDVSGQFSAVNDRFGTDCRKIVAIKCDVHDANGRTYAFEIRNLVGHAFGQRHTAPSDADKVKIVSAVILFDNLRRQTRQRAIDARAIHNASLLGEIHFTGY